MKNDTDIKRPLLSICIPTYNRALTLKQTLRELNDVVGGDPEIEIIVSDNASTDNTEEVVSEYPNIRYLRNDSNIKDANFTVALSSGRGDYLKLVNDTVYFTKNGIRRIKDEIRKHLQTKTPVHFLQNRPSKNSINLRYHNPDEMLDIMTVDITWIAVFGIWRQQFEQLEDKDRWVKTQFLQVDWTITNCISNPIGDVIYDDFYRFTPLNKKGGYNLYDTFINKYLGLLRHFKKDGVISYKSYKKEKKRLYLLDLMPWIPLIYINRDGIYEFEKKGSLQLLSKTYFMDWYFWVSIPKLTYLFIKEYTKKWISL